MKPHSSLVSSRDHIELTNHVSQNEKRKDTSNNQRGDQRFDLEQVIVLVDRASGHRIGHALDISTTGLSALVKVPVNPGESVTLTLWIEEPDGTVKFADIDGTIRWCHKRASRNSFSIGVEWSSLNAKAKLRIDSVLRRHHRKTD